MYSIGDQVKVRENIIFGDPDTDEVAGKLGTVVQVPQSGLEPGEDFTSLYHVAMQPFGEVWYFSEPELEHA